MTEAVHFKDASNCPCTLKTGTLAGTPLLWLGSDLETNRIPLNREQVRALINHLQHWLDTGSLAEKA